MLGFPLGSAVENGQLCAHSTLAEFGNDWVTFTLGFYTRKLSLGAVRGA